MDQSRSLFVYFCHFLDTISIMQIEKSIDGVLGIWTQGHRMVGADETTELWRPPYLLFALQHSLFKMVQFQVSFCSISFFSNKLHNKSLDVSRIRTWIDGVEGEHADHLITTTALSTFFVNEP